MPLEIHPRILIFLLTSIGLITLPHIYHVPISIFAFFAVLLTWRFVCIWYPRFLPHKIIIFLFTIGSIFLLFSQYRSVLGRDAGTSLFVIALSLKLLEIRFQRDLYLICYLAFIVASSQFLYEQSIFMGGYTLVVCCLLLATLITINSQQAQTLTALKKSGTILLQALPIATVIFILFPRVEAPRWMLFKDPNTKAKTGLADSLEPGAFNQLGMSGELVFRVKFTQEVPPKELLYWRGPVYSHTDGKTWTVSKLPPYVAHYMDKPSYMGKSYHYQIMMEPQDKNWVFALDMPARFSAELEKNANHQLLTLKDPKQRAEYQVTSYPNYNTGYITKGEFKVNTQLPRNNNAPSEKINDLVQQLGGFNSKPEVFIKNLLQYFRTENFHYTLMPPLMKEKPIETFLFETRYGFCSHYATAFVYLMRVAGIPARVVGGYQGGEINKVGGFLEVRQANAHAWTEVWLRDKGWVRFDPTTAVAPNRIEQGVDIDQQLAEGEVIFTPINIDNQNYNWLKEARQIWQSVDYSWQRWVINYNSANQKQFLSLFGILNLKAMLFSMLFIVAVIIAILAYFLLQRTQRTTDKTLLIYQHFCQKLAKQNLEHHNTETATDFAERACLKFPEKQLEINTITQIYLRLRYGKNPNADLLLKFKQLVTAFKV